MSIMDLTVDFEEEEELKKAVIYVCGLIEELAQEELVSLVGNEEQSILNDSGKKLFNEIVESGYAINVKDAVMATISVVESQRTRAVLSQMFEMMDFGESEEVEN